MFIQTLRWIALVISTLAILYNLIGNDWRKMGLASAIEFGIIFLFASLNLPISLALVKLLEGWMAIAILETTMSTISVMDEAIFDNHFTQMGRKEFLSPRLFRLFLAILVGIAIVANSSLVRILFPSLNSLQTITGLYLLVFGILMISFRQSIYSSAIGLLTFMGGFEVLFVGLESSVLLTGLLALVDLAIASVCAYLLYVRSEALR